jgi:uncharacterized protein (DUF2147 family)
MKILSTVIATVTFLGLGSGLVLADPNGTWKRPNGETAQVYSCGGKLCCKITQGVQVGFEMCHNMTKTGADTWEGAGMKHPEMPGFMTFNGTVSYSGSSLSIKGCAIGQSFCDAETWVKIK